MGFLNAITDTVPTPVLLAIPVQASLSAIEEFSTVAVLAVYTITNASLLTYQLTTGPQPPAVLATIFNLFTANVIFLATATVITVVRRLYFHPLSKFPGPKRFAVSKLWEGYLNYLGENGSRVRDLHRYYNSPIVRTGPNEVSVCSVDAIAPLYSRGQKHRTRGPWYDIWKFQGDINLLNTRNNDVHRLWRGLWDRAFTAQAMERYTVRVEEHVDRLVDATARFAKNGEVNMTKVIGNFTFDVMADLGFGQANYGLQTGEGDSSYMDSIHEYMCSLNVIATFRNFMDISLYLPLGKLPEIKQFREYGRKLLDQRLAMEKPPRDVATAFLETDPATGARFTMPQVKANVELLVIAGSDTTATILTNLIFTLTQRPEIQSKLHAEITDMVASGLPINAANTAKLPYLNAVINETLRLWPATPSGAQAMTGPEGLEIEGMKIPGNTVARVLHMAIHTDERYFVKPDEFIPERFMDNSELIKDRRAFFPFSYGQHACAGKAVALQELRLSTARLVQKFHFAPGPSALSAEEFRKAHKDYFTAMSGPNWVTITERE